jgi:hypothetical protein
VQLSLEKYAPSDIPDAENFAALPMFRAAYATLTGPAPNPSAGRLLPPVPRRPWEILSKDADRLECLATVFSKAGLIPEPTNDPSPMVCEHSTSRR